MTNTERFDEFKSNVQQWATDRGIYANGKASSQLLKALSELGELADGIAKNDREAIKDGVGDVSVCLVNYCTMTDLPIYTPKLERDKQYTNEESLGVIAAQIGGELRGFDTMYTDATIDHLCYISALNGLYFLDCCDHAWNEIKDRKGFLNENGVFVKESKL